MTCDETYDSDGKGVGDAELFAGMIGAMKILNFSDDDQKNIWKIVATVMHLGNLEFSGRQAGREHNKCPQAGRQAGNTINALKPLSLLAEAVQLAVVVFYIVFYIVHSCIYNRGVAHYSS